MDSPERIQIAGAPLSKFEDSPVFNFINSLSPIQPVNSVHCLQAYTSPGFASISSVFSSPHVNLPKESRFLLRQPYLDSSKQENSIEDGDGSTVVSNSIVATRETSNIKCSLNEATLEPPDESPSLPSDMPPFVEYNCGSPNHNTTPCYSTKLDPEPGRTTLAEPIQFVQDSFDKRKCLFGGDDHRIEQVKEEFPGCVWESLISNNAHDLLIFDASKKSEVGEGQDEKLGNNGSSFRTSYLPKPAEDVVDDSEETQPDSSFGPCLENTTLHPHTIHSGEDGDQDETDHALEIFAGTCHNQIESQQQRGMPRRCLVFEASGVSKRNLNSDSGLHSDSLPSNMKFAFDSRSVPLKLGTCSSGRVFPGIGLHLNTIGTTSKDRMLTQETLASGRRLTTMPSSIGSDLPRAVSQKSENDSGPTGSDVHNLQIMHDDAAWAPEFGSSEELSQSSPKKKRRKSENCGETEACKRCNCKKSKCLKLYCECFAAGVYCVESCSCQGCYNKPIHEETVLATRKQIESRNPLAFAPKVLHMCESVQDKSEKANKTPASAHHKRGCNCKK